MSQTPNPAPTSLLHESRDQINTLLRAELQQVFGRPISTYRDCIQLSDDIYTRTAFRINANTLRRFFGLVKAKYPPSVATLTILANYCGFDSPEDCLQLRKDGQGRDGQADKGLLHYLISVFKAIPDGYHQETTFSILVEQTIGLLQANPALANRFQGIVARTRTGQLFYFERFVNIDKLNAFYGEGLRYYLVRNASAEGQLFGHGLLCYRAWLNDDAEGLKRHFEEVRKLKPEPGFHPDISARYFAAGLLCAEQQGKKDDALLQAARRFYASINPQAARRPSFTPFELVMADALVLVGEYKEALFYIYAAQIRLEAGRSSKVASPLQQVLLLYQAAALAGQGEEQSARELFVRMRPDEFPFLSRCYFTLHYYLISKRLKEKCEQNKVGNLVRITGFRRWARVFGLPATLAGQEGSRPSVDL